MTAKLRFRRTTIDIPMTDGTVFRNIPAWVAGDWAIHRLPQNGELLPAYVVTFVATGLKFPNVRFDRLEQARQFVAGIPGLNLPKLIDRKGKDTTVRLGGRTKKRCINAVSRLYESITA